MARTITNRASNALKRGRAKEADDKQYRIGSTESADEEDEEAKDDQEEGEKQGLMNERNKQDKKKPVDLRMSENENKNETGEDENKNETDDDENENANEKDDDENEPAFESTSKPVSGIELNLPCSLQLQEHGEDENAEENEDEEGEKEHKTDEDVIGHIAENSIPVEGYSNALNEEKYKKRRASNAAEGGNNEEDDEEDEFGCAGKNCCKTCGRRYCQAAISLSLVE